MNKANENRKGYKPTSLGLIPEEWKEGLLKDNISVMTDYVSAGSFAAIKENVNVYNSVNYSIYVRLVDLRAGLGHEKQKYLDKSSYKFLKKSNLYGNEILVANIGANVGEAFLMPKIVEPATIAPNMIVIRCNNDLILYRFLYYFFKSDFGFYKINELVSGSGHPKLNKTDFRTLKVPIPPLPEQKKIAHILSTWDDAITTAEKLIEKLKTRKKGLMQQLLTGKTRLPGFGGKWKNVKLDDITERVTLKNTELNDNVVTISAQRGFVKQEDFFNKRVASNTLSGYYLLHKGEFSYNKSYSKGYPMGAFKRLDNLDKAVVTTLYICFKLKEGVNSDYLLNYFEAGLMIRNIMKIAQEGGRAHGLLNIGLSDFFSMELRIADIKEQNAIAEILTMANEEIRINKRYLQQLKTQKKGLMQKLLTGEVRVKLDREVL